MDKEYKIKRCGLCMVDNKKSKIEIGPSHMTQMGIKRFYDEEGWYHVHDPNIETTNYYCSNGHEWTEQNQNKCWCGETE